MITMRGFLVVVFLTTMFVVAIGSLKAETGMASFYGKGFHGRRTASGEIYNQEAATCAHKTRAFGTLLRVTDKRTGASVTCRVNDRGPFVAGRVVDLSVAKARELGILKRGVAHVEVE